MRRFQLVSFSVGLSFAGGCLGQVTPGAGGGGTSTSQSSAQTVVTPPVAHLTNVAYANTIADLFPGMTLPTLPALPADPIVDYFDNDSLAQAPTADLISAYNDSAQVIGDAALKNIATLAPCAASTALTAACAKSYVLDLASRAWRRPLTSDETTRMSTAIDTFTTSYADVGTALDLVTQAILQSPYFVYRIESGTAVKGRTDIAQLTPHELASRLSYFLWNSTPDAALRAAADDGSLLDDATLESQAQRLLADPRGHASIAHMHEQWLQFSDMNNMTKDATTFPLFNAQVAQAMQDSARAFVEHAFWDEGTLDAMLTDSHAYVNDALAPIYGLPAPGSTTLTLVQADATQRSGVLTLPGLLSAFAHPTTTSPVARGVFVLDDLLCLPPPEAPAGVSTVLPTATAGQVQTLRQEMVAEHEVGTCAACHKQIDGIGFGFEHYDGIGRWRTTDNTLPVDATGTIIGTADIDGAFDGAVELSQKLAGSSTVQSCVVRKWIQFSLGLDASLITPGVVSALRTQFAGDGLKLQDLLIAIVKSDSFRFVQVKS